MAVAKRPLAKTPKTATCPLSTGDDIIVLIAAATIENAEQLQTMAETMFRSR